MSTRRTHSLRFLDLPPELRVIIYENIPITVQHYTYHPPATQCDRTNIYPTITLITKSISTALLSTCHQVYSEALPVLASKLEYLRAEPTRYVVSQNAVRALSKVDYWSRTQDLGPDQNRHELTPWYSQHQGYRDMVARCAAWLGAGAEPLPQSVLRASSVLIAIDDLHDSLVQNPGSFRNFNGDPLCLDINSMMTWLRRRGISVKAVLKNDQDSHKAVQVMEGKGFRQLSDQEWSRDWEEGEIFI